MQVPTAGLDHYAAETGSLSLAMTVPAKDHHACGGESGTLLPYAAMARKPAENKESQYTGPNFVTTPVYHLERPIRR